MRVTADTRSSLASGSTVEQAADLDGELEEEKGLLVFPWEWPENVWDEIFHSMGAAGGQVQQLVCNLILTCPIRCSRSAAEDLPSYCGPGLRSSGFLAPEVQLQDFSNEHKTSAAHPRAHRLSNRLGRVLRLPRLGPKIAQGNQFGR